MFSRKVIWEDELDELKRMGEVGTTYQEIAIKYGVTRERVRQVLQKLIPEWGERYGLDAKRHRRIREEDEHRFRKWGNKEATPLYASQRKKFLAKKYNSTRIGHTWDLDFCDMEWPTHCPVLGIELDYFTPHTAENSPSFDQIVAGKGYVRGNVQVISWRANRIKNNGTADEHRKIADWLDSLTHKGYESQDNSV